MVVRADVEPGLLTWARHRSGLDLDDLRRRLPKLEGWERGDLSPTLKQLEGFARATHTPVGLTSRVELPGGIRGAWRGRGLRGPPG